MSAEQALMIFAKNPERGKVKTRLAQSVGDDEALAVYQKLLAWTRAESAKISADCFLYYSSKIEPNDEWHHATKRVQSIGDLGHKMADAFREQLAHYQKVCIIGTDCAGLTEEILNRAFEVLDTQDFVFGPANDGGYYLLGMKVFHLPLFENIAWSTSSVLEQSIEKVKKLGRSYFLLPELIDVDTLEDWDLVKDSFR